VNSVYVVTDRTLNEWVCFPHYFELLCSNFIPDCVMDRPNQIEKRGVGILGLFNHNLKFVDDVFLIAIVTDNLQMMLTRLYENIKHPCRQCQSVVIRTTTEVS